MRKRTIAAAITFALIAGVVAYQAATHVEPEPYVRLYSGRPEGPYARVECRDGRAYSIYRTNQGEDLEPALLDQPCSDFNPELNGSD